MMIQEELQTLLPCSINTDSLLRC